MQAAPPIIVGVRLMAVMLCQTQQSMAAVLLETTTALCEFYIGVFTNINNF